LTPYLTLFVDEQCRVPLEYVQDGTLTLNLGPAATGSLDIGNEWIMLSARFGGVPRELVFPVGAVTGIFARENGAGMEFVYEPSIVADVPSDSTAPDATAQDAALKPRPAKPHLHRVK
jgi:stringent starvation protein B